VHFFTDDLKKQVMDQVPFEHPIGICYSPETMMTSQFLPLSGMTFFFALGLGWRAWLQYRRHGTTGIVVFTATTTPLQLAREVLLLLVALALFAQTAAFAVCPRLVTNFFLLTPPEWAEELAAAVVFGGVILMVAAQLNMGVSWRVGIDETARPGLVTDGLYGFCRNPIYFAMFLTLAGLTVLLPTGLSVLGFLAIFLGVRSQVFAEEAYLRRAYGASFDAYAARTGRFVPGLGLIPRRMSNAV
jgi:protein-S-isoprenylcysteine O-methyltransferase Ste14